MTTKKTAKTSPKPTGEAPARKKLTLKKDALKDLAVPASARNAIKGGRSSSIAGSVVTGTGG